MQFERARYYVSKRRSGARIAATSRVPAQRRFNPRQFQIPARSALIDSVSLGRRARIPMHPGSRKRDTISELQVAEIESARLVWKRIAGDPRVDHAATSSPQCEH